MIRLVINGEAVDLAPGVTIRFETVNPLFELDQLKGSYSFPFTIPMSSPRNQRIFQFAHLLENRASAPKYYTAQLYLQDKLFFDGVFYVIRSGSSQITGNLTYGPGDFINLVTEKKLADVIQGTASFDRTIAEASVSLAPVDGSSWVCFPVENPDLYGESGSSVNANHDGYMNLWNPAAAATFKFPPNTVANVHVHTLTPFVYVCHLLREIFTNHGYAVNGDFYDDEEIKSLALYNNRTMDALNGSFINIYQSSIDLKNHVPDMAVIDYLKQLRPAFCIGYVFHPRLKQVSIVSMKGVLAQKKYRSWQHIVVPRTDEFTQDTSGYTFRFEPDGDENTDESYRYEDFEKVTKEYTEQFGILPVSATDGEMIWNTLDNNFLIYSAAAGLWNYYSENSYPQVIGDGAKEINSAFSPLQQVISDPAHPYIRNVGNSVLHTAAGDTEIKPYGLRLTFYRGLYDYGSGDVPVACSRDYDEDGNTWNYSLFWNGAKGLYNIWQKDFVEMMMGSKQVTIDVIMSIEDLFSFAPTEIIKIGNSRYLVANLSLTLTGQTYMRGTAILYRL